MKRKLKLILFLGLIFILPLLTIQFSSINQTLNSRYSENSNENKIKSADFWDLTGNPIFINDTATGVDAHNWTWVENRIWFGGGNGSWNNPYIIENITIDSLGTGNCIEVINSDVHFIIRNCTVFNSGLGASNAAINFYNITNGKLINNDCSNNLRQGIVLTESKNNLIFDNVASFNDYHGIGIYSSHVNNISDNIIDSNKRRGIDATYSHFNKIINNSISDNWRSGIYLFNCNYTLFMDNTINRNGWAIVGGLSGITSQGSSHNIFRNNIIDYNIYCGIEFSTGMNNTYIDNEIIGNHVSGLYLWSTKENFIVNNSIDYNAQGIYLSNSDNNEIIENTASHNVYDGIYITNSDLNNLTRNSINHNCLNGIYLRQSDNNSIIENTLIGNENCIYEENCIGNIFIDNICEKILKMFVEIYDQAFSLYYFNITFYIYDENNSGVIFDTIQIWWDSTDVSSDVQNIGGGLYFISLDPIIVYPGEDPILLNMTISADGYQDKYFEINIAVDPDTLEKKPGPTTPITPLWMVFLMALSIIIPFILLITAIILFIRRRRAS